jgi:Amt family ammonium transporter
MKNNIKKFGPATLLLLLALPGLAFAGDTKLNEAHTAWMLTATALVLFMTIPGLALFYGGLVRSKNVLSVLMQCFALTCIMSILWVAFGYSLAFGPNSAYDGALSPYIGGFAHFFGSGIKAGDVHSSGIPMYLHLAFQMTFAVITPALIIGGFAERVRFSSMLLFSILWLFLVYIPVCRWVWGDDGWLLKMNFWDLAGGSVVHINAGIAAIVAAIVIGRRKGFPQGQFIPHNLTMTVIGAAMLWVGWFGFNAGSQLAANGSASLTLVVTHLGASCGALAWIAMEWIKFGKPSVLGIVTGMVAGLGTITPASGVVGPMGAILLGIAAGIICFYATQYIKRVIKIDDSLDVFPVHGVGGILGTLAAGFLGIVLDGQQPKVAIMSQMGVQFLGVIITIVWCGVISWGLLKLVDKIVPLRVTDDQETEGLDVVLHEEKGYNL